jgi:hypothetical protein
MDPFFKSPSSIPKKRKSLSIAGVFNIEREMYPERYELKRKLKLMFPNIDQEVIENYVDKESWREEIDSPSKSKKKPPSSPYLASSKKKKETQKKKSKKLQKRSEETAKKLF